MPIEIKMPALSPTMEQGKLAKWLVKQGDTVGPGDLLAEIETDKATMEFEAVDEGTVLSLAVPEGAENVKVGTVIATLSGDGEDAAPPHAPEPPETVTAAEVPAAPPPPPPARIAIPANAISANRENRVIASPLAKRIAAEKGVDLAALKGSGPNGRIVKADVEAAEGGTAPKPAAEAPAAAAPVATAATAPPAPAQPEVKMADETRALLDARVPHTVQRLSQMRKTIARRLSQSMQEAPHIYLTVDIRLDRLLAMRGELNAALEKQGIKLSVNDLLIKALGKALVEVPECNVTYAGNELIKYSRADISVAVSIPGGLITPIVQDAERPQPVLDRHGHGRPRRAGEGGQADQRGIHRRHRQPLEHGHDGDQAVHRGDQPAAIDDPRHRRGREAALGDGGRHARRGDGDERDRELRSPRGGWRGRRAADGGVPGVCREAAGDAGV